MVLSTVTIAAPTYEDVATWVTADPLRMACLRTVSELFDGEWFIAAGFVRNLIWDKLSGYETATPLNDIDVIYFDPTNICADKDRGLELALAGRMPGCVWSVKNQARMSDKHAHPPYRDCLDAISYWPEKETAVAVTMLNGGGNLQVVSPFHSSEVVRLAVSRNPKCTTAVYNERLVEKDWLDSWPDLRMDM